MGDEKAYLGARYSAVKKAAPARHIFVSFECLAMSISHPCLFLRYGTRTQRNRCCFMALRAVVFSLLDPFAVKTSPAAQPFHSVPLPNHYENPTPMMTNDKCNRCTPEQKEIYYLCAPNRDLAVASPYFEAFKASGREVCSRRCRVSSTAHKILWSCSCISIHGCSITPWAIEGSVAYWYVGRTFQFLRAFC